MTDIYINASKFQSKFNIVCHFKNSWRYQGVKELEGYDWWGLLATYSGAGSVESLSLVKEETAAKIRELKESIWIRRGTRYLIFRSFHEIKTHQ